MRQRRKSSANTDHRLLFGSLTRASNLGQDKTQATLLRFVLDVDQDAPNSDPEGQTDKAA
jgi:hypothetical protein